MFQSLWTRYIASSRRRRGPYLHQDEWLYECTHLLADPDFIKYDLYHAELAKKRLVDFHSLFAACFHDRTWEAKKKEDRVSTDEVADAMLDVWDYVNKIKAAKERIHSKKDE